ncbi:amino acid transporter 10 [Trypanosoma brucei equiperdum]|uniref:Amino acid transporter 10 n=1 Tax=Trypanosoma brucei equiperdum TaxID=630700 RepID=A0A3L6L4E9_9TRYP|nr:amino acid transporter 10 [Trypanosoma brucei equiperdum]
MSNVRGNITPAVVYASNEPNAFNASDDGIKNYEAYEDIQSNNSESKFAPFSKLSKKIAAVIPPGGIFASAFNIAATTLGAGIFGLPSTANGSGLVMGIFYLVIINCMTIYSMYNLALAAERSKALTYEGVTFVVLGRWAAYAIAAVRAFDGFTSCIAYVISVGDIFSSILKGTDAPEFWKGNTGNRLLTALLWLCCMLPLVIPRHVDSLRHVSTFAVTFMVYFVIVIVVHSCLNGLPENIKDVSVGKSDTAAIILFNSGNAAVEGLGVFMFSYTCQDTAYEIYMDMKDRSVRKFVISSAIAMCMCTVLYILTVFFGYMDFGRDVTGSILLMYDPVNEPAVMVGMIGVLVKLIASYALLAMACRNALYSIAGKNADVLPFWKHCASVVTLSVAALVLGLFIPKVNTVLGFAGSITGGSLGYIFPSLLLMYSGGFTWQRVGPFHYLVAYGLLISGVVGVVFGTGATIWGTIVG